MHSSKWVYASIRKLNYNIVLKFIDEFFTLAKEIMNLPLMGHFPMVRLDCDDLKQGLVDKARSFSNRLLETIVARHKEENEK